MNSFPPKVQAFFIEFRCDLVRDLRFFNLFSMYLPHMYVAFYLIYRDVYRISIAKYSIFVAIKCFVVQEMSH